MNRAALLIDLQNDYLSAPSLEPSARELIAASSTFLTHCREQKIPVIHVWTTIDPHSGERMPHWKKQNRWICVQNTKGHEAPERLRPLPSEKIIHKVFFSAFSNPELLTLLKAQNIHTLYILGVHLHACVRATLLDAYSHGFEVIAIENALGSNDPVHAAITRRYLEERFVSFKRIDDLIPRKQFPHSTYKNRIEASPYQRIELLEKIAAQLTHRKEEMAHQMAIEIGKPIRLGRGEIDRAIELLNITMTYVDDLQTKKHNRFRYRFCPLGTVAIITPWNNPISIPIGKIGAALFYGNKVIWKPSPLAANTSNLLAECLITAGCTSDFVQVKTGGKETALALAASLEINAVSFSGSQLAGYAIHDVCSKRPIPFQGELGGNNAAIVWRDCNLSDAAEKIVSSAFGFAGQRCTANRRVIVDDFCFDPFIELLKTAMSHLHWGDPLDEKTDIGPVISLDKMHQIQQLIDRTKSPLIWQLIQAEPKDTYFPPTLVISEIDQEIVQEETFGPILVVQRAKHWEEAIQLCNGVRQGLVASLFSQSEENIQSFLQTVQAGILKLNRGTADADPEAPFGGWKASGIGAPEHGIADREFYTRMQAIYDY